MAKAEIIVRFSFNKIQFPLRDRKRLKRFIKSVFESEGKKLASLLYIFSTDKYLLALNNKYLNHNYQTDILTFPITTVDSIHAEIYISIERVRENSKLYNSTFKEELLRVIFHGALHLCGYKDKGQKQLDLMRKKENHYLKLYKSFT